ncbi:hypothetical protein RCL1_007747 [Eukaryota sp. TZLM3-RCL]
MDLWSQKKSMKDEHRCEMRELARQQEEEMKLLRLRHFEEDKALHQTQAAEMAELARCMEEEELREKEYKRTEKESRRTTCVQPCEPVCVQPCDPCATTGKHEKRRDDPCSRI